MDELIQKIIDIENKAQAIVKEARDEQKNLDVVIEAEINEMKSDIEKRASDKCKMIKNIEDEDAQRRLSEIEAEKNAVIERLEGIYQSKCNEWVDDIVNEIINV